MNGNELTDTQATNIEQQIESNPLQAAQELPEGSAAQEEALQLLDNNPYNDEVKNGAVQQLFNDKVNGVVEEEEDNPILKRINEKIMRSYLYWPIKNGTHVLDRGSIAIYTDDGKSASVKFGSYRQKALNKLSPEQLKMVLSIL